jgi:hypothetical protein
VPPAITVPPVLIRAGPLASVLVPLALAPVDGCSAGPPAPYQATVSACYAFAVQALDRHVTVTSVPRACAGLVPLRHKVKGRERRLSGAYSCHRCPHRR